MKSPSTGFKPVASARFTTTAHPQPCPRSDSNAHSHASETCPSTGLGYEGVPTSKFMPLEGLEPSPSRFSNVSLCRWSTEANERFTPCPESDSNAHLTPFESADSAVGLSGRPHSPSRTRTWIARLSAVCTPLVLRDIKNGSGGRTRTAVYRGMSPTPWPLGDTALNQSHCSSEIRTQTILFNRQAHYRYAKEHHVRYNDLTHTGRENRTLACCLEGSRADRYATPAHIGWS